MIWATRSRSQAPRTRGRDRPAPARAVRASAGTNSPATERASSPRSTGSVVSSSDPGVQPRQVEQVHRELLQPLHLLGHRVEELARVASSRSSSWSSSTKPPREKIGVRSSCEAVATNSLRATSTRRSCPASR